MGLRSYSYLSCGFLCPRKCSLFLFNATNIRSMIVGVLCYFYLSCGKFCIQTRVNTGPQSPQLLHCMFTTVIEVSIKTGSKKNHTGLVKKKANYNHGLVVWVIWAWDRQVGGHWSGHWSMNKRGCITGFIITMAWLAQWLDNCGSFFQKSWFWTPSSQTFENDWSVKELWW